MTNPRRIDRITTHTCPGLEADAAYFRSQGRSLFRCDSGHPPITVHYAQFSMLCAECRIECLDESDVAPEACAWCGADHALSLKACPACAGQPNSFHDPDCGR